MNETRLVGKSVPRVDARLKVTGGARYTADLVQPGMLWGAVLRSPHPHARIVQIDTSRARKLPGVAGVITGQDTPGIKYGFLPTTRDQYPLAIDKVRFIGDEVAAVAAFDRETAMEALQLIQVEYELLPAVFDPEEAMQEGAPQLHEHAPGNISAETHMDFGDVDAGFRQSDVIREDVFTTQNVLHGFIEPHAVLAQWDTSGKLTIWASKQSPYIVYRNLARSLELPSSKVRIIQPHIGGGFGGKHEPMALDFCAALLSRQTGRPVKIVYEQEEVFIAGRRRHPMRFQLQTGVKKDGTIMACRCRLVADGGAYASVGALSIYLAGAFLTLPLRLPNLRYDAYRIYTNKPFSGALRGHAIPQSRFAFESQLDDIAQEIGLDPVEIRLRNAIQPGEKTVNGFEVTSCGLEESIRGAAAAINWDAIKQQQQQARSSKGAKIRGVGIACNGLVSGARLSGHVASTAVIKVHEDGRVSLITGSTDVGQGSDTVLAQMLAEELGLDMDDVEVAQLDTDSTPLDPGTFSSRVTFCTGNAVRLAAVQVRQQLTAAAAGKLKAKPEELEMKDGRIGVPGQPERSLSYLDAVRISFYSLARPIIGVGTYSPGTEVMDFSTGKGNVSSAYSFGAQVAEVEVDTETGQVQVIRMVAAHDSGRAINPLMVEGQLEGAAAGGIGQVFYEELPHDAGLTLTPNFMDYGMPSIKDVPHHVQIIHVETNDPNGPFGAKEAGEGTQVSTIPAIASAICDALGVRIRELPITPAQILKALEQRQLSAEGGTDNAPATI